MADIRVAKNEATAARRRVYFFLVDATDFATPETGEAGGQPQVSVDGGAWTNTGIGTLTAIGNGQYYADLTQALVNVDDAVIRTRYKSANTAECPGDTVIVDSRAHNANVTQWLGTACATPTVNGVPEVDVTHINGGATNGNNATLSLKKLDINNPDASGDAIQLVGARHGINSSGSVNGAQFSGGTNGAQFSGGTSLDLFLFGTKHNLFDRLTSAITVAGSIGKLIVDNLNASVSSRLPSSGYTAPDNTGIADIKAKTDQLTFTDGKVDANASGGGAIGPGADQVTLHLGAIGAGAEVWISTDAGGENVIAGTLVADDDGDATFMLDAGDTYYLWRKKPRANFPNPTLFVAVAD